YVPKVGMLFPSLEEARKFYADYARRRTNAVYAANCPARMYVHHLNMIDSWEISKVVLEHSHPCCPIQAEMFPQYHLMSMKVRRTIEINDQAGIPPSKSY
ncbi:hypothetical protein PIB30_103784, partial [Stylosanthes scabra]|nr:hypothetical protein [Stylosanthes scabra]